MSEGQDCKLTIYVARPTLWLTGEKRKRRNKETEDIRQKFAGHSFVGLTDENGIEKRIGFFAKFTVVGEENVSKEDVIRSPKDLFRRVSGILKDETNTQYHEAIEYKISKEQYEKANEFIETWRNKQEKYSVLANNCVSFASKVAKNIGLVPPRKLIALIPTPLGASLSIKFKEKIEKMSFLSKKIKDKLSNFFGGAGKVFDFTPNLFAKGKSRIGSSSFSMKKIVMRRQGHTSS